MATKTLVTKFGHANEAESAATKLRLDGFASDAVGWVTRGDDGREIAHGNLVRHEKIPPVKRSVVGGVLGGLVGLLIGITALTIAGVLGTILVVVSLVVAFLGIWLGVAAGRGIDAFVHVDEPLEQAHRYATQLGKDSAIVRVTVKDEAQEARALEILRGEADLHRHPLVWRIPALSDEGRPSKPSLA
ncbi:MAG: hypothetical protein ACXWUG_02215 [Polyangiales bacterium]